MLVLTRKVSERLVLNGNITIAVLAVQGDRVRIGVIAPKDVRVDREEVHDRRREDLAVMRL